MILTYFQNHFSSFQIQIVETESPCDHGYFNRGDLEDPDVAACVDLTYSEMLDFFAERL